MAHSQLRAQRKLEGAMISAAGDLARAGLLDFEGIVEALEGAGFAGARHLLSKPHLRRSIERIVRASRARMEAKLSEVRVGQPRD